MFHVPANFVRFTAIDGYSGYGFLGAVAYLEYIAPSDPICELTRSYPGELTMIVTLINVILSTSLFTVSVKEALRHRMWKPISLIHLNTGVALAQGSHILKHQYMGLTVLTLFIFGMLRLLTAGWTTFLTPTYFMWPVELNRTELDITGSAPGQCFRNSRHRRNAQWSCRRRVYLWYSQDIQFQWGKI
ncbi:hypothetical protein BDR03DRAFT_976372 [Suillus americanus]|nr:hypothetical protein BDR03DRAFT_976372 [Suillus americanus]